MTVPDQPCINTDKTLAKTAPSTDDPIFRCRSAADPKETRAALSATPNAPFGMVKALYDLQGLTNGHQHVYACFMGRDQTNADYPDIRVCACANLRRATRMVTQAYDAALRPAGLRTTQFTMLSVLAERGRTRQSAFADILGMDGTTLTRNLRPLLKNGWIRVDREQDLRVRLISITKQGRRIVDEAVPLWRQVQSRFVTGLGDERWSGMMDTLTAAVDIAKRP